jgi:hypothetical protein
LPGWKPRSPVGMVQERARLWATLAERGRDASKQRPKSVTKSEGGRLKRSQDARGQSESTLVWRFGHNGGRRERKTGGVEFDSQRAAKVG